MRRKVRAAAKRILQAAARAQARLDPRPFVWTAVKGAVRLLRRDLERGPPKFG